MKITTHRLRAISAQASLLLATFLLSSGCARVKIQHVPAGSTGNGVHFFEPSPFLLVAKILKQDKDGKPLPPEFSSQIIYLPDPSRRYEVSIKPGWGTVDGSVKLINGWMLDSLGAKMDSKGPETISAIAGLAKEIAAAAAESPEGLYKIVIDPATGAVSLQKQDDWR